MVWWKGGSERCLRVPVFFKIVNCIKFRG
uniref:Uncharacterized protein n=1 Tax=Anguilla anguilla TaxID=7936 RepID=A0A0E9VUQ3_ANGAN